jgi:hypothetical protein
VQGQGIVTVTSLRNPRRELAKELEARRQLEGRDKQENMEREARQEGGVFTLVFTEIRCDGLRSSVYGYKKPRDTEFTRYTSGSISSYNYIRRHDIKS